MRVLVPLLILLTTLVPHAHADTAAELASACRPVAAARVSGDSVYFQQTYDSGRCWGAFTIIQRISSYVDSQGSRPLHACVPPTSTRQQLVAVFVEFLNRNPQRMHEDAFEMSIEALTVAFPCTK
jgi:hypothetical protein